MQRQRIACRSAAAVAVLACASTSARAEWPTDNYWIGLEYFYPAINSTARLDSSTRGRGVTVNFEQDLDLSGREGTSYLTLGMRLGDRWRLQLEYYRINRDGTKVLDQQIDWGDTSFPVDGTLETKLDSTVYRLTGGYSFYKEPNAEAGIGFGFHVTDFKTQLSGQGTGASAGFGFQREIHHTLVPLPTLGLYGTYVFAEKFAVRGRVDYLSLRVDQYNGSLVNWQAGIDWRFAKIWVAGVGYRYVDYKLDSENADFVGHVQYRFQGPTIYLNAQF
jgi:hypothetical protein